MARVLHFSRMATRGNKEEEEFLFVQFMEWSPLHDNMNISSGVCKSAGEQ